MPRGFRTRSFTVAVTVWDVSMTFVAEAGRSVSVAGGPGDHVTVTFAPSPASSVPFSSMSAKTWTVLLPEVVFENAKLFVPAALVGLALALDGLGEPTPLTEKLTGMNDSSSPFAPVTWAVTVAVDPTSNVCVAGVTARVCGGEKLTRAVKASVPETPVRASAQDGWSTSSEPAKLPL